MHQQHTHQYKSPASPMLPQLEFNNDLSAFTQKVLSKSNVITANITTNVTNVQYYSTE